MVYEDVFNDFTGLIIFGIFVGEWQKQINVDGTSIFWL